MNISFTVFEIKSVLFLHAPVVPELFGSLLKKIFNKSEKILLAFVKKLTNTEACTESRHRILSLSVVGFLHVITSHWTGEKSAEIDMSTPKILIKE
jgi:hypothetical protein